MVQEIKMEANVVTVKVDGKCASCPLAPSPLGLPLVSLLINKTITHCLVPFI